MARDGIAICPVQGWHLAGKPDVRFLQSHEHSPASNIRVGLPRSSPQNPSERVHSAPTVGQCWKGHESDDNLLPATFFPDVCSVQQR